MRVLLATLALLAPDPTFDRDGVLRMDEPRVASAVIPAAGGGTLHATTGGLLHVSAGGRPTLRPLDPPAQPVDLVRASGGAVAVGTAPTAYGEPQQLGVWLAGGTFRSVAVPGVQNLWPRRIVRRGRGFAVLVDYYGPDYENRSLVATLTADGELASVLRLPRGSSAIGSGPRGELTAVTFPARCIRRSAQYVRVQRFNSAGARTRDRRVRAGGGRCGSLEPGEVQVDSRGRTTVSLGLGRDIGLLRLTRGLRPDRRFGRGGLARHTASFSWWAPVRFERRPRGGYVLAWTEGGSVPRGYVGLIDPRGRRVRERRLKTTRSFPTSIVHDVALDRRGRVYAAGALHDTDIFIREDYGQPHLAVWRLVP